MEILTAINKRLDGFEKRFDGHDDQFQTIRQYKEVSDAQFETIRQEITDNAVRFDRLEGSFLLLRADLRELTEEIRHDRKILV